MDTVLGVLSVFFRTSVGKPTLLCESRLSLVMAGSEAADVCRAGAVAQRIATSAGPDQACLLDVRGTLGASWFKLLVEVTLIAETCLDIACSFGDTSVRSSGNGETARVAKGLLVGMLMFLISMEGT